MDSLARSTAPRNGNSPRRKALLLRPRFRLRWRRERWSLMTANRYRRFESLEDAMSFVRRLQAWERTSGGKLHAALEERDGRRWHELPIGDPQ